MSVIRVIKMEKDCYGIVVCICVCESKNDENCVKVMI